MIYEFNTNVDTGEISRRFNDYTNEAEENFLKDIKKLRDNGFLNSITFYDLFESYVLTEWGHPYFEVCELEIDNDKLTCHVEPTRFNPYREDFIKDNALEVLTVYFDEE